MASPWSCCVCKSIALRQAGQLLTLSRFARVRRLGITGLQLDDYFVAFGGAWYTILCVAFNQMLSGGGSNLLTEEEIEALTPETIAARVEGSKWVFVSEHAMLLTIWSMKAAMLVLYARITSGSNLVQRRLLKGAAIWVVLAFIGDELALFLICRPVTEYWAVPAANGELTSPSEQQHINETLVQCSTYEYYQIVNAIFNISTDILILAIGIPPVMKARLSLQQKLVLGIIFGMGTFVIVAAILRAIYCLVPALVSYVYMNWYFREATVAVYVTNLPPIWALLRELFPNIHVFGYSARKTGSKTAGQTSNPTWGTVRSEHRTQNKDFDFDMETVPISKTHVTTTEHELHDRNLSRTDSVPGDGSSTSSGPYASKNEIRRDVTFTVEHLPADRLEPKERQQRRF